MVVGGTNPDARQDVEVINLKDPGSNCIKPANCPLDRFSVGTFMDGKAYVCQDYDEKKCYFYQNSTNEWIQTFSTIWFRKLAAGIRLTDDEFWILAGQHYSTYLDTSEICSASSGSCEEFVDLPENDSIYPKAARVNASHIFVKPNQFKKSWLFNQNDETFHQLPDMAESRAGPFVGSVNGKEIVVGRDSVEIYDLTTNEWRSGPRPPIDEGNNLSTAVSVQYKDSFILVGGKLNDYDYNQDIFQFNAQTHQWQILEQKLQRERYYFTAFLVPEDYITCS